MSRAQDVQRLWEQGLNDAQIARALGIYPRAVRRVREKLALPTNWEPSDKRAVYRVTHLESGETITGDVTAAAQFTGRSEESFRAMFCYQKNYGRRKAVFKIERVNECEDV